MRFYIKQKVFSWRDRFYIYDEYGNEVFAVEGEVFSWGKKLHLYDKMGNELTYIHQKVMSFLPRYKVSRNEVEVAEVVKDFTFFQNSYTVSGKGFQWKVKGNFFTHTYDVFDGSYYIARVYKEWFTFGDAYAIDLAPEVDIPLAISVVLIIDAVIDSQED